MTDQLIEDRRAEVHLSPSSLVKVLGQLRFPTIMNIERVVPAFQRRIAEWYPVLRPEKVHEAAFGPDGVTTKNVQLWRFWDLNQQWSVVLSESFVAIETTNYTTRDDFVTRIETLLAALKSAKARPAVIDRLGLRYVNRLTGEDAEDLLPSLVSPQMHGLVGETLPGGMEVLLNVQHIRCKMNDSELQARWGRVGPNMMLVQDVDPVPGTSWLLDIDVYREQTVPFDPAAISAAAREACTHAYDFFRWTMTDSFFEARRAK